MCHFFQVFQVFQEAWENQQFLMFVITVHPTGPFSTSLQTKNVFVVFGDQPLVSSTVFGNKEIFTQQQHGKKTQLKFISSTVTFFLKIFHPVDVGNHRVDPLSLKV